MSYQHSAPGTAAHTERLVNSARGQGEEFLRGTDTAHLCGKSGNLGQGLKIHIPHNIISILKMKNL